MPHDIITSYPSMFYHKITDKDTMTKMETLRRYQLEYAKMILELCPANRERSLWRLLEIYKCQQVSMSSNGENL